jgi:hypothetical protein
MGRMEPGSTPWRPGRMRPERPIRGILALVVVLAAGALSPWRVAACSCVGGELPEMIRGADVAFVGTPQRSAKAPRDELGPRNRYAFAVERANRETGATIEILAWSGGDAGCGIEFAIGERWLVLAHAQDGRLETNLCNGNVRVDELADPLRADLPQLLPLVPDPAPYEPATFEWAGPTLGVLAIVLLVGATSAFVFRRRGLS